MSTHKLHCDCTGFSVIYLIILQCAWAFHHHLHLFAYAFLYWFLSLLYTSPVFNKNFLLCCSLTCLGRTCCLAPVTIGWMLLHPFLRFPWEPGRKEFQDGSLLNGFSLGGDGNYCTTIWFWNKIDSSLMGVGRALYPHNHKLYPWKIDHTWHSKIDNTQKMDHTEYVQDRAYSALTCLGFPCTTYQNYLKKR